jgi:CRP/FNR family cyclic AMP-dependent transcriptional regulator
MGRKRITPFNPQSFLTQVGSGKTTLPVQKKQILFSQGDASDAVFYIQAGQVKLTVVSQQGKEAVVAILEPGAFFGESCLAGQTVRTASIASERGQRQPRQGSTFIMSTIQGSLQRD